MNSEKFYFQMSLVLGAAFLIWVFGAPFKDVQTTNEDKQKFQLKGTPSALTDFVLPVLIVFNDSENVLPKRDWLVPAIELNAEAAIAMRPDGGRIYYNKNMEARRPIASLTKLMTAIIVLGNYDLNDVIKISREKAEPDG